MITFRNSSSNWCINVSRNSFWNFSQNSCRNFSWKFEENPAGVPSRLFAKFPSEVPSVLEVWARQSSFVNFCKTSARISSRFLINYFLSDFKSFFISSFKNFFRSNFALVVYLEISPRVAIEGLKRIAVIFLHQIAEISIDFFLGKFSQDCLCKFLQLLCVNVPRSSLSGVHSRGFFRNYFLQLLFWY